MPGVRELSFRKLGPEEGKTCKEKKEKGGENRDGGKGPLENYCGKGGERAAVGLDFACKKDEGAPPCVKPSLGCGEGRLS